MNALKAGFSNAWRFVRKDPIIVGLVALIVLALIPMPFLGYRVLSPGGRQGTVVPILPTATSTPTPTPTATPTPIPTSTPTPTPTPTPLEAPLSGFAISSEDLRWPPIAVMIPSDSEQYAMSQASVIYEVAAEYSIQRFLVIFERVDSEKIGPVRSARPYYVEWACPYHPLYVHWGGSPQAYELLARIDCLHQLDGMTGAFPFWRAEIVDIPWNNGFTDSERLYRYIRTEGLTRTVDLQGYEHKEDALLESRPLTGTISINAFRFSVRYVYDRESNTFLREYKGGPHLDLLTGEQHRANNVVVISVSTGPIPDDPKGRIDVITTGEGEALIFLDGVVVQGRWVRESREAELRLLDETGQEIAFNRGNIWIEVLASEQEVIYDLGQPPP